MSNEHGAVYFHETATLNLFVVDVPRFQRNGMKRESGTCLLLTEVPGKPPANINVSHWLVWRCTANVALIWEFNEMACLIPKYILFSAMSSVLWMQFSLMHLCIWMKACPKVIMKRTDHTKLSLWELHYLQFTLFLHKYDLKHCQTQTCYAFVYCWQDFLAFGQELTT